MARVTAAEVLVIMDDCDAAEATVDVFIIAANEMVTLLFADNTTYTATLLKEIERYWSAHLLASTICRTAAEEKVGDASVKYTGSWGEMLKGTSYGQTVLSLDIYGVIKESTKRSAKITAILS